MSSKITKAEKSKLFYSKFKKILADGAINKKLKLLKKAVKLDPVNISAIYAAAKQLVKKLQYNEAIKLYKLILDIDSYNYEALFDIAKCYYNIKEYKTAVEYYEKLFIMTPGKKNLMIELMKTHAALKNPETVFRYIHLVRPLLTDNFEKSVVCFQASRAFWDSGNTEKALAFINQAIKYDPSDYDCYIQRIIYLMCDEKYGEALDKCEELKGMSRNSDYLYLKMAIMLEARRTLEVSRIFDENYEEIIKNFHESNTFRFLSSYFLCDRAADGLKIFEKCLRMKIGDNHFLMYALDYYFFNDLFEIGFYIASIIIKKHNVTLVNRGYAYYRIAQYYRIHEKNYPAAVKYALEALNYDENISLLYELGLSTMLAGSGKTALGFFYKFLNRYETLDKFCKLINEKCYESALHHIEKIKKTLNL